MAKTPKAAKVKKGDGGEQEGFIIHEGLSGLRANPGMYLGQRGSDMAYRCVKEPVDNVYDEMIAGRNKVLEVIIDYDNDLNIVADCASGIPTTFKTLKDGSRESIMTAAFSRVHAGGKFNDQAYKTSAGTHGVGVAALNAVSSQLRVWSMYKGDCAYQMWQCGGAKSGKDPKSVKGVDKDVMSLLRDRKHTAYGTIVAWTLDQTVVSADVMRGKSLPKNYTHAAPDKEHIRTWLRNMSLLNPGFEIRLSIISGGKREDFLFHNKKDLAHVVTTMIGDSDLDIIGKPFVFKSDNITAAIAWTNHADTDKFLSFVNTSPTVDGGWHVVGFREALFDAIKPYMKEPKGKGKKKQTFKQDDLLIGLTGMYDWRMHGAQYTSQVKDKLASRVEKEVYALLKDKFVKYFDENKKVAANIIKRAEAMSKGREELGNVVKGLAETKAKSKGGLILPELLTMATRAKPDQRELYIVEGDSAGGCFIGTTPVKLADGRILTFEELANRTELGEEFEGVSFNIDKQTFERHLFVRPRLTKYADELVEVEMSDGTVYVCTLDHPWLVDGYRYVAACDLSPGDSLTKCVDLNLEHLTVKSIRRMKLGKPVPVYDATMPVHHNFCLGNGVVVHNTADNARIPDYQEILKCGGKPLNAVGSSLAKVLGHDVVQAFLIALGVDLKSLDPQADKPELSTKGLRCKAVFFLADADPDGKHINALLLAVAYRLMPDLFKEGRILIVDSPLYSAIYKGKVYGGSTYQECRDNAPPQVSLIIRAKGWGEVEPDVMHEIAFNPKNRKLYRINPFASSESEKLFRQIVSESPEARRVLLGLE